MNAECACELEQELKDKSINAIPTIILTPLLGFVEFKWDE
jgi:hypothetical protein